MEHSQNTGQKILVVDDEKAIVELIKVKLEVSGFEVHIAHDGLEALDVMKKVAPDLIILDILMPRMDGFQFYKKIKDNPNTSSIPFLIMTGRGAMRDTFEGLGVESFLVKPFEPEELDFHVRKILAQKSETPKPSRKALIGGTDEEKLQMMRKQLEAKGYVVELATTGAEALGKALQILPELFIVQFDMPQMNAEEITKILQAHPDGQRISVVVYSLLSSQGEFEKSSWGYLLIQNKKKVISERETPIKVIDKFDTKSFLEKIKDFL